MCIIVCISVFSCFHCFLSFLKHILHFHCPQLPPSLPSIFFPVPFPREASSYIQLLRLVEVETRDEKAVSCFLLSLAALL